VSGVHHDLGRLLGRELPQGAQEGPQPRTGGVDVELGSADDRLTGRKTQVVPDLVHRRGQRQFGPLQTFSALVLERRRVAEVEPGQEHPALQRVDVLGTGGLQEGLRVGLHGPAVGPAGHHPDVARVVVAAVHLSAVAAPGAHQVSSGV
jgi:hypothetical protein